MKPIEITDSLAKTDLVQRIHQNQKLSSEALGQFQKSLQNRLNEQVNITPPVPRDDEVVLHVNDERQEQKNPGKHRQREESGTVEESDASIQDDRPGDGHIDIKA